jgi:hypothetical protein
MTVFVTPIENVLVRNPKTKEIIPKEGMLVELNSFWQRRINDGSLILGEPKIEKQTDRKPFMRKGKEE